MDLSGTISPLQTPPGGGGFAAGMDHDPVSAVTSGKRGVKDAKRRVELKQTPDKKASVVKKAAQSSRQPAARKHNAPAKRGILPAVSNDGIVSPDGKEERKEELVADHELDILLDSFESETFTGKLPIEPSSHGDDPTATDELWRRLTNTAWLRNPESTADDGNSSTVTQR